MKLLIKKIEQMKISDDCYSGENLEHEFNFLYNLEQEIEEKVDDSRGSNFFGKKSMSFCVEIKEEFDQKKAKKLIELVGWITDEHFVKKSILGQVS